MVVSEVAWAHRNDVDVLLAPLVEHLWTVVCQSRGVSLALAMGHRPRCFLAAIECHSYRLILVVVAHGHEDKGGDHGGGGLDHDRMFSMIEVVRGYDEFSSMPSRTRHQVLHGCTCQLQNCVAKATCKMG